MSKSPGSGPSPITLLLSEAVPLEQRIKFLNTLVSMGEATLMEMAKVRQQMNDLSLSIRDLAPHTDVAAEFDNLNRNTDQVRNVHELCSLFRAEASALIADLWTAQGFRRSLYCRALILVTYESALTLRGLLGPEFRKAMCKVLGEDADARLKAIHRDVSAAYDQSNASFGLLRDKLIGHRDKDALLRFELYANLNPVEAVDLAKALLIPLDRLVDENIRFLFACVQRSQEQNAKLKTDHIRFLTSSGN